MAPDEKLPSQRKLYRQMVSLGSKTRIKTYILSPPILQLSSTTIRLAANLAHVVAYEPPTPINYKFYSHS